MGAKRFSLAVASLIVAALCFAVPAVAGAAPSYVAIGDSYTAGPGINPVEPGSPAGCARSELNYPHLVAAALKLSLTDVSCSGAATKDETSSQFEGVAPQDDALSESTEVVTIGMGGNDHGLFSTLLNGCTQIDAIEGSPEKAPCKEHFEALVQEIFALDKPAEEESLVHIKELAPHAKVFIVGYPEITPLHGHCAAFPWHEADLKWFRNKVQKVGNKSVKAGAKANGAIFVDTFKPSEGHNACQEVGTRWIEPILGSLTGVPVHPNALGEENDAFDVEEAMLRNGVR